MSHEICLRIFEAKHFNNVTFKLSLPTCQNMGSMEILGFYVVTSA